MFTYQISPFSFSSFSILIFRFYSVIPFALLFAWKILDYIHAAVAAELDQVAAAEHKATIVATGRRLGQVVLQLAGICHSI
jgi:hypothetical protein